jgi:hypothetical protein
MKGLRRRQRNRKRDRRRNIECELLSRLVVLPEYVVGSRQGIQMMKRMRHSHDVRAHSHTHARM